MSFMSTSEFQEYKRNHEKRTVSYEWVRECVDEYDDIIETDVVDSIREGFDITVDPHLQIRVALTRIYGNAVEGIVQRGYAYIEGDTIGPEFDCGHKVPKKYISQLETYLV